MYFVFCNVSPGLKSPDVRRHTTKRWDREGTSQTEATGFLNRGQLVRWHFRYLSALVSVDLLELGWSCQPRT